MISVIGGKLTTAAQLARECAEKIGARYDKRVNWLSFLGQSGSRARSVGGRYCQRRWNQRRTRHAAWSEWHGKRALTIARMAISRAELRAPLCSTANTSWRRQWMLSPTMRSHHGRRSAAPRAGSSRRLLVRDVQSDAAARIGAVMGLERAASCYRMEAFETRTCAFLRKPSVMNAFLEAAAD